MRIGRRSGKDSGTGSDVETESALEAKAGDVFAESSYVLSGMAKSGLSSAMLCEGSATSASKVSRDGLSRCGALECSRLLSIIRA